MTELLVTDTTLPEAYHSALKALYEHSEITPCPDYNTTQKECSMTMCVSAPLSEPMISRLFIGGPRELEQYRRILTPVIDAVCRKHLRAFGCTAPLEILWDDITLKDTVDEATARHLDAQTKEILQSIGETGKEN